MGTDTSNSQVLSVFIVMEVVSKFASTMFETFHKNIHLSAVYPSGISHELERYIPWSVFDKEYKLLMSTLKNL